MSQSNSIFSLSDVVTKYGSDYFLNKISLDSSGNVKNSFDVAIFSRVSGSQDLNQITNTVTATISNSSVNVRSLDSPIDLTFNSGETFDELYFIVFLFDDVTQSEYPLFIKQIDNSAYVDGGILTINSIDLSFVDVGSRYEFTFPYLDPTAKVRFKGGGSLNLTIPEPVSVTYDFTGGGSLGLSIGSASQVNYTLTGDGSLNLTVQVQQSGARTTESGTDRLTESGSTRLVESA